jgi:plastocyanin
MPGERRKVRIAHSNGATALLRRWLAAAAIGAALPGVAHAQAVHVIRLEVDADHDIHRFVPARITARPGDVLRFRVASGAPHSIQFERAGLSEAAHAALNAALPGRVADLTGPVLERDAMEYRITLPALPPGRYVFVSLPHRAYDMRGELIVQK